MALMHLQTVRLEKLYERVNSATKPLLSRRYVFTSKNKGRKIQFPLREYLLKRTLYGGVQKKLADAQNICII